MRALLSLAAFACMTMLSHASLAEPDPDMKRLADGKSVKWNWEPPGTHARYGHAEVLVHAPFPSVRRQVLDYAHYKDLVPEKFHNARIVGKEGAMTEVYMQVPIMHGMVTLWDVMKFTELKPVAPDWSIVEGWLVKGNVKDANAVWTVHRIDDEFTVLKFDLLIVPTIPAPQSALDEELRDAAMDAINAMHDRAQGSNLPVAYPSASSSSPAPVK
jgi:hypothetical protein